MRSSPLSTGFGLGLGFGSFLQWWGGPGAVPAHLFCSLLFPGARERRASGFVGIVRPYG